jgi:hypothetical protein
MTLTSVNFSDQMRRSRTAAITAYSDRAARRSVEAVCVASP